MSPASHGRAGLRGRGLLAAAVIGMSAVFTGCASSPVADPAAGASGPTFLIVRHAEKSPDDPRDPRLTPAGTARAQRLAAELRDAPLVAVYSTDTRRTRATAEPAANAHRLAVTGYDPRAVDAFARELRARHRDGLVLVVGHSNTAPALAAALCTCTVAPMDEHEYGVRYRLRAPSAEAAARLDAEAW